jgi:hypothetical protein
MSGRIFSPPAASAISLLPLAFAAALALTPLPVRADDSATSFSIRPSLAVGVFALFPSAPASVNARPDPALALEPSLEIGRVFISGLVLHNSNGAFANGPVEAGLLGGRVGYYFIDGPVTPYASIGLAYLAERLYTDWDEGSMFDASGAALLLEAGVQLFRRPGVGRVSVSAQAVIPFFSVQTWGNAGSTSTMPFFLLGLKVAI